MAFYLDSSATAKLVVAEPDSEAMTSWAAAHETQVIASDLLRTELLRATRRSAPDRMQRARSVLDALTLYLVSPRPRSNERPPLIPKVCEVWMPSISLLPWN